MYAAAAFADAARRLEDSAAIYRFKSRTTVDEFDEWCSQWCDSRARRFASLHMQPQREIIEEGSRLCRLQAELISNAQTAAGAAEREAASFGSARDEFESAQASSQHAIQSCRDLAARAHADSSRAASAIATLQASIAAAAQDPGW